MTQALWDQAQADFPIEKQMATEHGTCFCRCGCRASGAGGPQCSKCRKSQSLAHGPATPASIYNDLMDALEDATPAVRPNVAAHPVPEVVEQPIMVAQRPRKATPRPRRAAEATVRMVAFTDVVAGGYASQGNDGTWYAMLVQKIGPLALVTVKGPGPVEILRGHMSSLARTLMLDPAGARETYKQLMEMGSD